MAQNALTLLKGIIAYNITSTAPRGKKWGGAGKLRWTEKSIELVYVKQVFSEPYPHYAN